MSLRSASATAHSNIALIKYWGKRAGANPQLNLPAVGSLSMTLDELRTDTQIEAGSADTFVLDGAVPSAPEVSRKVFAHLDLLWASGHAGARPPTRVVSTNHLPTAAGLASSASGFAALTLAAAAAYSLDHQEARLSQFARMGSGSAARSLWGGFVRLDAGTRDDGEDCVARPVFGADHWDLRLLIVHTVKGPKAVGSTEGMRRSLETSPYYPAWVETSPADLDEAQAALGARDLERLGELMEHSCFKMHACMMASRPPLVYWRGTSLEVMHELWRARKDGLHGYATSDAGPHIKVLCTAEQAPALMQRIEQVPGITGLQCVRVGPAAQVQIAGEASAS